MNILHILSKSDSYDTVAGVLDLSKHLLNSDYNCIVASSLEPDVAEFNSSRIRNYQLPHFESNIRNIFLGYSRLKEVVRANKIDIVHTYSPISSMLAFFVCRHTDRLLVTTCNDFYSKNIFNHVFILAKKIIIHNESVGKNLINNFNLPRERIRLIKQGLNLKNFHFQGVDQRSKTDFNIGIIPSLLPHDGYEYFLKAMVKVVRIIPHIKICVISLKSQLKQEVRQDFGLWVRRLGLTNYVKFFETTDSKILSKLNLLIYTPIKESASTRVLLEAQAYGVPVIATQVAGLADVIVDNKTGFLVSPKDNSALVGAITRILRNLQLSREIISAARSKVEEEFSLEKNIGELLNTYEEVKNSKRILVINLGKAQDIISSIPAFRILRGENPNAQINVLITSGTRCLLQRCPYIDELVVYDSASRRRSLLGFISILKLTIKNKFDIVFDFTNSFKTHLLSYLSLANKRYGYSVGLFRFLINYSIDRDSKSFSLVEYKLNILSLCGIKVKDYRLELWLSQEDIDFADNFLKNNWIGKEKIVGMDISFRKSLFQDPKLLDYLSYLYRILTSRHIRVILTGLKDNFFRKDEILKRTGTKLISITGNISATQLACIIKRCNMYISSNPESLYIAIAMKTPSIILSSSRNKSNFSPYKNVESLTDRDFYLGLNPRHRRISAKIALDKDVVKETVNRMLQLK